MLKFSSMASVNTEFRVYLRQSNAPFATISDVKTFTVSAGRKENEFLFSFPATEPNASIGFETSSQNVIFWLDNIQLNEVNATVTNPDDSIRFEYNATNSPRTVMLDRKYIDAKNNHYSNILILQPYTSIILLADTASTVITANIPPVVSIVNPIGNTAFNAPAIINITANATDADGTISKVVFYNGTTILGTDIAAPYTFNWIGVAAGTYTITAKATDNAGMSSSTSVSVSVNAVTPPVFNFNSFTGTHSGTSVTLNWQTVNISTTTYFDIERTGTGDRYKKIGRVNYTSIPGATADYSYTDGFPLANGTYRIKRVDKAGLASYSNPITVSQNGAGTADPSSLKGTGQTMGSENNTEKKSESINNIFSEKQPSLQAGPIPALNTLNVYTEGFEENKEMFITVVSMNGQMVKQVKANSNSKSFPLNINGLHAGTYLLRIDCGATKLNRQFVKM